MSEGVFRKSPAISYAGDKGLTRRRTRSAILIDAFLLRSEKVFLQLLALPEERIRAICEPWHLAPNIDGAKYRPPVLVGQHALLAFPGTMIESIEEDESRRTTTRLLIKAADDGVVFNLTARAALGHIDWDWRSMEQAPEGIRDDCLKRLLDRVKQLVRIEIPQLVARASA